MQIQTTHIYGTIVYNSLTNSLIELGYSSENLLVYQANIPFVTIEIGERGLS